jgi:hypothetical protein
MPFDSRIEQSTNGIEILKAQIWEKPPFAGRIIIVPSGYENRVLDDARQLLISMKNITAKFIRFTPDYFLIDKDKKDQNNEPFIYMFDYKTTQTPLYKRERIAMIADAAHIPNLRAEDIGQMETDAYENYQRIHSLGVRVVLLNYCAYHPRLLLCDYIERIKVIWQGRVTTNTQTGSRTPFINFYCPSTRDFQEFLAQEHDIHLNPQIYNAVLEELKDKLPVKHLSDSPHNRIR